MTTASSNHKSPDILSDPMTQYAWSQTSVDCTQCGKHFAIPPESCDTEDAVVAWAARIAPEAKSAGWVATEEATTLSILCPVCAASHANI